MYDPERGPCPTCGARGVEYCKGGDEQGKCGYPAPPGPPGAARLVYWMQAAPPDEHPQAVMHKLASDKAFRILGAVPQSIADQWWFWIEWEGKRPELPSYVSPGKWLPVGTA